MNNLDIEKQLIKKFGAERTINFCEMVSVMFDMMYLESKRLNLDKENDYDFDRDWWKDKRTDLLIKYSR